MDDFAISLDALEEETATTCQKNAVAVGQNSKVFLNKNEEYLLTRALKIMG
jgi:hypothetical protein